ncbi:hypothetical protein BC835DRAFT_1316813 [Cytidiella melzeri]|nr:hypothetical protein BC835DRAFT_1316813 [Cytidiella melzeri]
MFLALVMSFIPSAFEFLVRGVTKSSNEALFCYTSGRFLYNEAEQLAARCRIQCDSTATPGSSSCWGRSLYAHDEDP